MDHGRRRRIHARGRLGAGETTSAASPTSFCTASCAVSAPLPPPRAPASSHASLPELVLGDDLVVHERASFLDAVDGALAAYSTATAHVHNLEITMPNRCHDVPSHRVASWLRFASRRLAGALRLCVSYRVLPRLIGQWQPWPPALHEGDELDLPQCERATSIVLRLGSRFFLRLPPPAGTFPALADLEISFTTVEGRAIEALVSTQCPQLRNLSMFALKLVAASDISVRSGTLRQLKFDVRDTLLLYVAAPALQVLDVESVGDHVYASVHVAAPNLAEVVWGSECADFVFADAGRHLRRLEVKRRGAMAPLMRRFNSVDQLELRLHCLITGVAWKRFWDDTNYNFPKCQTLCISSIGNGHAFAPTVLHLLRRGKGIRKLHVSYSTYRSEICSPACVCRLPKSSTTDNIILDSLEEIKIGLFLGSAYEFVEFLKHFLFNIWSNTKNKSVETNMLHCDPSLISEVCKMIHAMCPPNIRIKSNVFAEEIVRARFETSPIYMT